MPTLDWLNRDAAFRTADAVPYRLIETVSTHGDGDARNLLLQGDNLEALKALLPFYRAQVKCIFIDPPYNTQSAFEHYDDNLEHSQWLSLMLPRLQLLREFLRPDGSIWVTIDDNEGHYLKVLMDEVFGRRNFVASFAWEKDKGRRNDTDVSGAHDHVLLFKQRVAASKKSLAEEAFNLMPRTEKADAQYQVFDEPTGRSSAGLGISKERHHGQRPRADRREPLRSPIETLAVGQEP